MEKYKLNNTVKFHQKYYGEVEGTVVYSDDSIAILIVKSLDDTAFPITLFYNEVMSRYPYSNIPKPKNLSQLYLCIDKENDVSAHFYNCLSGSIGDIDLDEYEIYYDNEDEDNSCILPEGPDMETCDIELPEGFIESMEENNAIYANKSAEDVYLSEKDCQENSDIVVQAQIKACACGVNRVLSWMSICDCAILTAWYGDEKRNIKDQKNKILLQQLKEYGYGVSKVRGSYINNDNILEKENSFFVCNIHDDKNFFDVIYSLSESFQQECFLYKEGGSMHPALLVGTNDKFGKGHIEIAGRLHIGKMAGKGWSELSGGKAITFG